MANGWFRSVALGDVLSSPVFISTQAAPTTCICTLLEAVSISSLGPCSTNDVEADRFLFVFFGVWVTAADPPHSALSKP